jgi:hypothetical protein
MTWKWHGMAWQGMANVMAWKWNNNGMAWKDMEMVWK